MNLVTNRLRLKDYTSDDFKHYWQLKSNRRVWEYAAFSPYESECEASHHFNQLIESLKDNPYQFSALWTKESNRFVGEAGIISFNQRTNKCVIGYNLLPEFWNIGFATEITKALVSYAFEEMVIERVEALVMSQNTASCNVLKKSGFTLEGTLRHFTKINDQYFDVCYYAIISPDWV